MLALAVAFVVLLALVAALAPGRMVGIRWRGELRWGQPPPPLVAPTPIDADDRFEPVPQRSIVVPLVAGALLVAAAVALAVAGAEPIAAFVGVVGLLELGAAASAARRNRRALDFLEERLFDGGSRSGRREGEP